MVFFDKTCSIIGRNYTILVQYSEIMVHISHNSKP